MNLVDVLCGTIRQWLITAAFVNKHDYTVTVIFPF